MYETPEEFIKKTFIVTFYLTTGILIILAVIFSKLNIRLGIIYFISIFLFIMMFFYFLKMPEVRISRRGREIDKEIVYAGRFLILELESGVTLYRAMANVSKSYEHIGKYFNEIVDKVDLGTSMERAIREAIELNPNKNFRKIMWQILNALKTGVEVSHSLNAVVEQIIKEQMIEIKEYGKKLTPLAMFYMMISVIIPSLGIVMLIVASSFFSISLDLPLLLSLAFFLMAIQAMFLAIIKNSRPAMEV